ncbi:transposase [Candidatus Aerophobetes bacterium]|nr:transposase [Candidatus Aerophobetes bacterium]
MQIAKRIYTPKKIINKLRGAEVLVSQGSKVGEAARKIGVTEQTYYRWRREYSGMRIDQVIKSKELQLASLFLSRIYRVMPQSRT